VLRPGDILFTAKSLSHNALIYDGNNILKEIAAPQFIIISVNRTEVMPEYIVWFLNSGLGQSYLNKMSEGSSLQIISIKLLGELEIPIIPIDEQERIIRLNQLKLKEEKLLTRLREKRKLLIDMALERQINRFQRKV
jgi:restriction endonuclease S subunit